MYVFWLHLLISSVNHRWTQMNTDTACEICVYLCSSVVLYTSKDQNKLKSHPIIGHKYLWPSKTIQMLFPEKAFMTLRDTHKHENAIFGANLILYRQHRALSSTSHFLTGFTGYWCCFVSCKSCKSSLDKIRVPLRPSAVNIEPVKLLNRWLMELFYFTKCRLIQMSYFSVTPESNWHEFEIKSLLKHLI